MSFRVLWNSLVPWRRRRRYFFLAILSRLEELDVPREAWPGIFDVTPERFLELQAGRATPRLFVQSLGRLAYHVPEPPSITGEIILAAAVIAAFLFFAFMLLR